MKLKHVKKTSIQNHVESICNMSNAKTQVVQAILEVILSASNIKNLLSNEKTRNYWNL